MDKYIITLNSSISYLFADGITCQLHRYSQHSIKFFIVAQNHTLTIFTSLKYKDMRQKNPVRLALTHRTGLTSKLFDSIFKIRI